MEAVREKPATLKAGRYKYIAIVNSGKEGCDGFG
jgi:hypothetical protein